MRIFAIRRGNRTTGASITIYGQIGKDVMGDGVSSKDVLDQLAQIGGVPTIDVHLNSIGGNVAEGLAIYNALVAHPARVIVHIDGVAASAAAFLAMAGDEILIAENALMMIHQATGGVRGNADDMRDAAEAMDRANESAIGIFMARTGQGRDVIERLVKDGDTFLTATEALSLGLVTKVVPNKSIAAHAASMKDHTVSSTAMGGRNTQSKEHTMNWFAQMGATTEAEGLTVVSNLQQFKSSVVSAIGAADPSQAGTRITELVQKEKEHAVLVAKCATLEASAAEFAAKQEKLEIDAQVAQLDAEKKLPPTQVAFFRGLDAKSRLAFIASAVALVAPAGAAVVPVAEVGAEYKMTEADEAMLRLTPGMDRKEYQDARKADVAKLVMQGGGV